MKDSKPGADNRKGEAAKELCDEEQKRQQFMLHTMIYGIDRK